MNAGYVVGRYQALGFRCDARPDYMAVGFLMAVDCHTGHESLELGDPDVFVQAFGRSVFVTAEVDNPDVAQAACLLGDVAALPYTGSKPETARQWVVSSLGNSGETGFFISGETGFFMTIGDVDFALRVGTKPGLQYVLYMSRAWTHAPSSPP